MCLQVVIIYFAAVSLLLNKESTRYTNALHAKGTERKKKGQKTRCSLA